MDDNIVIVTRHSGMVEWLGRNGVEGEVLERASRDDVEGMRVYGKLPLHLAALTESYFTISIPNVTKRLDNADRNLSADEMEELGAYLNGYIIYEIVMK